MVTGLNYTASTLARGIRQYPKKTRDEILEILEEVALEVEDYMKDNAPWEDRTGDARDGLAAEVSSGFEAWGSNAASITLSHAVEYGIWLEVRWGGRFAIIIPTMEKMGPEVMKRLEGITEDIIYYV